MAKKKDKIDTTGGNSLSSDNPFSSLGGLDLPAGKPVEARPIVEKISKKGKKPRETLLLRRLKAGKGGKVVTEISGFTGNPQVRQLLLKRLQGRLGTGGTLKGTVIELQGELREQVKPLLEEDGYRVKG